MFVSRQALCQERFPLQSVVRVEEYRLAPVFPQCYPAKPARQVTPVALDDGAV